MTLSPEFEASADTLIARYPASKQSAVLPLLHLWQETFGYVSDGGIQWIAKKLELECIQVLELATFYPMLKNEPMGKIHIKVCRTLSCALAGSKDLYDSFKRLLALSGDGEKPLTTPDGKFTLEFVECLACCDKAPVVLVNEELHENMNNQRAETLIKGYKK
ncbi:MAG: NADH-quinone oxidoreductase subunit NuoE [Verrucomicrobiota bacterium]